MIYIGIDIGTTTICAVAADSVSGAAVESVTSENNTFMEGQPFERLQDPEAILRKAMGLIEHFTQKYDVGGIGITGQMHGIVYIDGDGSSASPLYIWQDGRGDLPYKDGMTYAQYVAKSTGGKAASGYGGVTHFYNTVNDLVPAQAKTFCTIHDYLAMKLTGRLTPAVHPSDAASFGCYDIKNNRFDAEIMDTSFFPEVEVGKKIIGKTASGIPVSAAIGDNQASFIGSVREPDSSILINVGTGSQISVMSREAVETDNIEARPFDSGTFLSVGASLCGGRAYALIKDFFDEIITKATGQSCKGLYDVMDGMGEAAYESGGIVEVDTRFGGTRHDTSIRGGITGIGLDNFTPGAFAAGVQQGMANELYNLYSEVKSNVKPQRIIGSGNGIRKNKLLQRIVSEKFGLPLFIPKFNEEAAFGAALFAMSGTGEFETLAQAQKIINLIEV